MEEAEMKAGYANTDQGCDFQVVNSESVQITLTTLNQTLRLGQNCNIQIPLEIETPKCIQRSVWQVHWRRIRKFWLGTPNSVFTLFLPNRTGDSTNPSLRELTSYHGQDSSPVKNRTHSFSVESAMNSQQPVATDEFSHKMKCFQMDHGMNTIS